MAEEKITTTETVTAPVEPKTEPPKSVQELEAEIERLKAANEKQKDAISKANGEAAEWKRQFRETQTEQQRAEAERAEREKAREARIAELEAKERVSNYKSKLMDGGVDHAAADIMAKALPEGVSDEYFATLKSYLSNQRQAVETAALNKQPGLSVGMPPTGSVKTEEDAKYDRWFGLT